MTWKGVVGQWLGHAARRIWLKTLPLEDQFPEQFWYGHREILSVCLDKNRDSILHGHLQHGWSPVGYLVESRGFKDSQGQPTPIHVWNWSDAEGLSNKGYAPLVTGSPWSHLLVEVFGSKERASRRSKVDSPQATLVAPSHSTESTRGMSSLIRSGWPANRDATYLLYWLDYCSPEIRMNLEAYGHRIECVGFRGSLRRQGPWVDVGGRSHYLIRLLRLLESISLVVLDKPSTLAWYAMSMGIPVRIVSWDQNGAMETDNREDQMKLRSWTRDFHLPIDIDVVDSEAAWKVLGDPSDAQIELMHWESASVAARGELVRSYDRAASSISSLSGGRDRKSI